MGDIEIAADYHVSSRFPQRIAFPEYRIAEIKLVVESFSSIPTVGKVGVDQGEIPVFKHLYPSFIIKTLFAEETYRKKLLFEIDGTAAVTLFLCTGPDGPVAGRSRKVVGELVGMRFGLLQAEYIGLRFAEPVKESFTGGGTDAVDVPGDDFHTGFFREIRS